MDCRDRRGRSREEEGGGVLPPMSEWECEFDGDFRRLRGKKPRVRRGRRAISTAEANPSIVTQESCFHGGSESAGGPVTEMEGEEGTLEKGVSCGCWFWVVKGHGGRWAVGVGMKSSSEASFKSSGVGAASGNFRPLTPQASTGSMTTFRI